MLNRKVTIILSTVRLIKKDTRLNDCIFFETETLGGKREGPKNVDLTNLKLEIFKLDIYQLETPHQLI